jgi:hypothetical protein
MAVLNSMLVARMRAIAPTFLVATALTYASLAVPGTVTAVCGNLGTPVYCPVLAYGFPLPYLADSQAISPVGSVARDPVSVLTGEDELLGPPLAFDSLFWLLATAAARWVWRHRRRGGRRR